MKNPLAWLAGAVVLYLATRPRGVGSLLVPEGGRTGSIDGHTTDWRTRLGYTGPPDLNPADCPTLGSQLYFWEGECVRWYDLPTSRQQQLLLASQDIR